MSRTTISFLPAFFTILIAAFAVVVAWRIHSYSIPRQIASRNATAPVSQTARHETAALARPEPPPAVESATTSHESPKTAAEIARDKRYRELLISPPPAGPSTTHPRSSASPAGVTAPGTKASSPSKPQPLQPSPSVRTPLVSILTGGSSSTTTPPAPRQGEQPAAKSKDPTSDSTPPQLLSVEFIPPQVRDSEETLLAVTASDDISGVRTVSGSIASPTGGLIGFALTREGDTNRYVSRIAVPKDAPEGIWKINYLNLMDNASNAAMFSASQGAIPGGVFRVISSRPDNSPPVLKALWLDRQAMKAGEHDIVFVQADDDKSGVALVSGVFRSPSKLARVGFGCRNPGSVWECDFMPPLSVDCGDWQLEQVQLQDKANNMVVVREDNPLVGSVRLNIFSDQCDAQPPVLLAVALVPTTVKNTQESIITVTVSVTDNLSGVGSVSGHAVGPSDSGNPPRLFFSCSPSGDQQTWIGRITVPRTAAKGIWAIGSLQVLDKANNLRIYTRGDPLVAVAQFRVE